jgi:hypothetical protein
VHDEGCAIDLVMRVIFTRVIRDEPFDVPKTDVTLLLKNAEEFFAVRRVRIELIDTG